MKNKNDQRIRAKYLLPAQADEKIHSIDPVREIEKRGSLCFTERNPVIDGRIVRYNALDQFPVLPERSVNRGYITVKFIIQDSYR